VGRHGDAGKEWPCLRNYTLTPIRAPDPQFVPKAERGNPRASERGWPFRNCTLTSIYSTRVMNGVSLT
jgi:hypothetical protein